MMIQKTVATQPAPAAPESRMYSESKCASSVGQSVSQMMMMMMMMIACAW